MMPALFPSPAYKGAPDVLSRIANSRLPGVTACLVLVFSFVPFLVLGPDSYITIHDNLDGEFVHKCILARTGQAFTLHPAATIPYLMNGVPRFTYPSGFNLTFLPLLLLPPYWAYIANHIAVRLIAFVGMWVLLRRHFLQDRCHRAILPLVALCFSLIPFYSQYGLSVAGQPLLLFAFLNLRSEHRRWMDYAIIGLFPFYASFVLAGPFLVTALLFLLVLDWRRTGKINRPSLAALVLFVTISLGIESQMIRGQLLNTTFVSHRMFWDRWTDLNLSSNLRRSFELLLRTQYHTGSFPTAIVLFTALWALYFSYRNHRLDPMVLSLLATILAICVIAGFYDWIAHYGGMAVRSLRYFNASRFYFLLPTLWLVLFARSLQVVTPQRSLGQCSFLLLAAQIAITLNADAELKNNTKLILGRSIDAPTYRQFFAEEMFSAIMRHLGQPPSSYRIVSIGMHPSVSQFNGFYTLDGYQPSYDASFHRAFRRIIAPELDKDKSLSDYFDTWGNRCYIFDAELGKSYLYGKTSRAAIHNITLNMPALSQLGCQYVFSAVPIENPEHTGLILDSQYSDPSSFWRVYIYRIL